MSLLTIPNVLVNGTGPASIVDAVGLNANFTAIATAVNNIYPSQILPITTAQATFGATATGVGYKFLANDTTAVPLTIDGVTSQSAALLNMHLTSGGTIILQVASNGLLQLAPTINATNTLAPVPPGYNASGAALGGTLHFVYFTFAGTGGTVTTNLTGAAAFAGAATYWCVVYDLATGAVVNTNVTQSAGSIAVALTTNAQNYAVFAIGT